MESSHFMSEYTFICPKLQGQNLCQSVLVPVISERNHWYSSHHHSISIAFQRRRNPSLPEALYHCPGDREGGQGRSCYHQTLHLDKNRLEMYRDYYTCK